jgi:tRNA (guanine-N7-)-methyltransferase
VRLHHGDARDLIGRLPDASIDRLIILFPDPWPKARHAKRRLVQPDFVGEAARVLKIGARVRFATDWADYADWALKRFLASPEFRWTAEAADDWRSPPADHVTTRYETKRLGDCAPLWLEFERVGI